MLKKLNIRILLLVAVVLAGIVITTYLLDNRKGDRTFKSELLSVDTSSATAIRIFPKGGKGDPLRLERSGNQWEIIAGKKRYPADSSAMRSILGSLVSLKAERVAASDPSGWKTFEIDDSLARRVVVEQNGQTVADFMTGKVSFIQNRSNPYGNQGFITKSHVRLPDDDRVYVVDGFLSMLFTDQPSMYRFRQVCVFDRNRASKLLFIYPGDSSFQLTKSGTRWLVDGRPADSARTAQFIGSISATSHSEFADADSVPLTFPYRLRIEGDGMTAIEISGAADPVKNTWYIRSSANPGAVFSSTGTGLFSRIFVPRSRF